MLGLVGSGERGLDLDGRRVAAHAPLAPLAFLHNAICATAVGRVAAWDGGRRELRLRNLGRWLFRSLCALALVDVSAPLLLHVAVQVLHLSRGRGCRED